MRLPLLFVVAAALLVAADAKDDAVKKEKAKLKGTWQVLSFEEDGEKVPEEVVQAMRLVFQDDKIVVRGSPETSYALDPTQKPAALDLTPTDGPAKGKTARGIYLLDGDDLKICTAANPPDDRPKEFSAKKAEKATLIILKREKK